ncbi:MAG: patatin-like phospholipase RssA [Gammaproteobacteria bacterium]|nr:patatin-like phospholipase RssA [Gammaproteobacteria bacterium]
MPHSPTPHRKARIGLALGSGSARGWSHIGVIQALEKAGIHCDIVCGCSIGAIVAAAYANDRLHHLEEGVRKLDNWNMLQFFELNLNTRGFIHSERLNDFFEQYVCATDLLIENLEKPFGTVATELKTGREVWFKSGSLLDAIWSSFALPGLFSPVKHQGKWLVDGGLVNPVPVSLCRALGADIVIAVNLNGDLVGHRNQLQPTYSGEAPPVVDEDQDIIDSITSIIRKKSISLFTSDEGDSRAPPSLIETMAASINITQDHITRSRMAGNPPDIMLCPRLSQIGLLEIDRGDEAITEGKRCVERLLPEIEYLINI